MRDSSKDAILPVDLVALVRACRRTQRMFGRLATRLSDASNRSANVEKAMQELAEQLSGVFGVGSAGCRRPSSEEDAMMRAEARVGAADLRIEHCADGSGEVSVNGRRAFRLRPQLATLLTILAAAGSHAEDGLMGWQTTSEVAAALDENRKHGATPAAAVPKLIFRLRRAFRDAGDNEHLIQTHRDHGVRVAVRVIARDDR